MRWVNFAPSQLDALTGSPITLIGQMPLICHGGTVTAEIREFFRLAGIPLDGRYLTYTSLEEAIALAQECQRRGQILLYYYPPPDEVTNGDGLIFPPKLYDWLNDKANIDRLCPTCHQPPHQFFQPDDRAALSGYLPDRALYLKLCHPGVSGGGADVFYCPDAASRLQAFDWMAQRPTGWSAIRAEEAVEVRDSWCLNLFIESGGVRYLGAPAQLFGQPGKQAGSRIDPDNQPSGATVALAIEIGHRARRLGFVGVAGFDIGEDGNGRPFVFDLNFRFAACTPQLLMHSAAASRVGGRISQSLKYQFPGPLSPVLRHLEKTALEGRFVPLRLYETSGQEGDCSRINGMLIGATQKEIDELETALEGELAGLATPP